MYTRGVSVVGFKSMQRRFDGSILYIDTAHPIRPSACRPHASCI